MLIGFGPATVAPALTNSRILRSTGNDMCWLNGSSASTRYVHATRSYQLSVLDAEQMNQGIGVDVVEVVPGRNLWSFFQKQCSEVGIFTVEVNDVGGEVPLLQ